MIRKYTLTVAMLLAVLVPVSMAQAQWDRSYIADEGSWGGSRWMEESGTAPTAMPGLDSVYWQASLVYQDAAGNRSRVMPTVSTGHCSWAHSLWLDGDQAALDDNGLPRFRFVSWAMPESLEEAFLQHGQLDLPDFLPHDLQKYRDRLHATGIPPLDEAQQLALFHELLAGSRRVVLDGICLYIYAPEMQQVEIRLGWRDKEQPVRPPEFYRSEAELAAEQAAGLEYQKGFTTTTALTIYPAKGGQWAGGEG